MSKTTPEKELEKLAALVCQHRTIMQPNYVVGLYRYWAKIDALEQALLKKGAVSQADIDREMIVALKRMQEDFRTHPRS